jgi:hypothetical protein
LRLFTIGNAGLQQEQLITVTCQKGQRLEGLGQVVEHSVAEDDVETLPEILGRVIQVQEADRLLRIALSQKGQIVRPSFGDDYFAIAIQEKGCEVANAGSDFENPQMFEGQVQGSQMLQTALIDPLIVTVGEVRERIFCRIRSLRGDAWGRMGQESGC